MICLTRRMKSVCTFIARVIEVDEIFFPVFGQSWGINGISVILTCDMATSSGEIKSWDIVGTIPDVPVSMRLHSWNVHSTLPIF